MTDNKASQPSDTGNTDRSIGKSHDTISLPRWVVYFQAALLGIVAATFFIFGMMVSSLTDENGNHVAGDTDVRVFGTVAKMLDGQQAPAAGAVVLLLPDQPLNISRQDPTTIRPDSFQPLENPTIDSIRATGGSVVRSNIDGKFELFARPGSYNLLIISKTSSSSQQKLNKQQVATISQYFLPVEKLIQNQHYYWQTIRVGETDVEITDAIISL